VPIETATFAFTAGALFVSTIGFLWFTTTGDYENDYLYLPPVITFLAGGAYTVMAASSSGIIAADIILEMRYADWLVTTPLIVAYLGLVAGARRQIIGVAMAADAVMIVAGFIATTASTAVVQWAGYAVSSIAFLGLVYLFVTAFTNALGSVSAAAQGMFRTLRDLTIFLWFVYPIAWLFGPSAGGWISTVDYHFIVAILDMSAKIGFNLIIAFSLVRVTELVDTTEQSETPA